MKAGIKAPYPELRGSISSLQFPAFAEVKLDGEYNQVEYRTEDYGNKRAIFCVNKYGTIKSDFPALNDVLERIERKADSCTFICEVFTNDGSLGELYTFLKMKKSDALQLVIHDISMLDGTDLTRRSTLDRKEILNEVLGADMAMKTRLVQSKDEAKDLFESLTGKGYEGIVLKDLHSPLVYGPCGWVKMKYKDRSDYKVTFIDPNRERIEIVAIYSPSMAPVSRVEVGVKAPNKYKRYIQVGDMVTIEHQGVLKSGSLRHPVLIKKKEWI